MMSNKNLHSIFQSTFIFIIFLLILLPLLIIILIPIFVLRIFAILTSKCNPSLGRILSAMSSVFAVDDLYKEPRCTLVTILTFENKIDPIELRKRFQNLLDKETYPELKQGLSRWMGFYFWKNDPRFTLDNHLRFINEETLDPERKLIEREKFVKKPYTQGQPLWEINAYQKCTGGGSVLMVRLHHSLVDGYSALSFFNKIIDERTIPLAQPNFKKRSLLSKVLFNLKLLIFGPVEVIKSVMESKDENEWKIRSENAQGVHFKSEDSISMDFVKEIGKIHSSKTGAIIFSALTGGIRNYMLEVGCKIPAHLTIIYPLPIPSHPDQLTNYATMAPIQAPVSEPNPLERLKMIQRAFKTLEKSTLPYGYASLIKIVGLISALSTKGQSAALGTAAMTNFPFPKLPIHIGGVKCTEMSLAAGLQRKGMGLAFSSVSYDGKLLLTVKADRKLFPDPKSTKEILKFVMQEFKILAKSSELIV